MLMLRTAALFLPAIFAACSESSSGPGKPTDKPGLTVVAGSGLEDTVATQPARPITLEFRDRAGQRAPGVAVTLTPSDTLYEGRSGAGDVFLLRSGSPITRRTLTDTTDSRGRLVVMVLMGFRAGVAGLVVSAPSIGVNDTIPLRVFPAAPVRIASSPSDTAAYVGGSYLLRAFAVDRYGNRTDTIARTATFSSLTPGVTVAGSGQVTAATIGRQRLLVRIGERSDTVSVSVVPVGTIAAHQTPTGIGQSFRVVTVNLDGSGLRQIASEGVPWIITGGEIAPGHSMRPTWDASGQRLAYQDFRRDTRQRD